MGGVDRNDEILSFYTAARKTQKWYKKLATHLLEEAMLNAYILHKKAGSKKSHFDFLRSALTDLLLEGRQGLQAQRHAAEAGGQELAATPPAPVPTATPARTAPAAAGMPPHLGAHFLGIIPPTAKKDKPQKKCKVCKDEHNIRRDVRTHCKKCPGNPGFCIPCFEQYHK